MTTKTIAGTYSDGYALQSPTTTLHVAGSGYIGGAFVAKGLYTPATDTEAYTVVNDGHIVGFANDHYYGVVLGHGGSVTNGSAKYASAEIDGFGGVSIVGAAGTVTNFALVMGDYGDGVYLGAGGRVANGGVTDASAVIHGYVGVGISGAAGSVVNDGSITAARLGVALQAGGTVINGTRKDTGALIQGGNYTYYSRNGPETSYGVVVNAGVGTVTNYGTVEGQGGVGLYDGGTVTNGGHGDTTALIQGGAPKQNGVAIFKAPGSVANFGTIAGSVALYAGGAVVNDASGLIDAGAAAGVYIDGGAGAITNLGTIAGDNGVVLFAGGVLTNGAAGDTGALIQGSGDLAAVYLEGVATVTNFGTIASPGGVALVFVSPGGRLIAEAGSSFIGAVQGGEGTLELVSGTGTITGLGSQATVSGAVAMSFSGFGAYQINSGAWTLAGTDTLGAGVTLTSNGTLGLIGSLTVDGAIGGRGGLSLEAASDRLTLGAGAAISGAVKGGGGTLELGPANGTITNLGAAAVISGGVAMRFSGFGAYQLDAGGDWTLAGTSTLGVDRSLTDYAAITGALRLTAASDRLRLGAGASISGSVKGGGGTLELLSGTSSLSGLGGSATLSGSEAMTFSGFGAYELDAGVASTLNGRNVIGAGKALTDDGALTVAGGASLAGAAGLSFGADATLTNFGSITGGVDLDGAGDRLIAEAGSTLRGSAIGSGGTLELGAASGTISGLGAGGTVSGGLATTFGGFGAYQLDAGGAWTLATTTVLGANQSLTVFAQIDDGLSLGSASATLAVGAGAAISGAVSGGGGTLAFLSQGATVTGLGGTGTLSGSGAMTFSGFGDYVVTAGAAVTAIGSSSGALSVDGSLLNLGVINSATGAGATLGAGGSVTNGSAADTAALISSGFDGLYAGGSGPAEVTNFGAIQAYFDGVDLTAGGSVVNGSAFDTGATIAGAVDAYKLAIPEGSGIAISGAAGTVTNYGSILAVPTFRSTALHLGDGGRVTNGANSDTSALIQGYSYGVSINDAPGIVTNFGTIRGIEDGVRLLGGGEITNGSASDHGASISGLTGVAAGGSASVTLTNFGNIGGRGGAGVSLGASSDVLIAEAGSEISGQAMSAGGTLVIGSGNVTLTGLGLSGTVSGDESLTFAGFASYVVDPGVSVTLTGANVLVSGESLTIEGSATNLGAIEAISDGVVLTAGARLSNASETALISGLYGVHASGAAEVSNSGTIIALGTAFNDGGIVLYAGGSVTNGSAFDTTALIQATAHGSGVLMAGGAGSVANYGAIRAGYGVVLEGGGVVKNGGGASIEGSQIGVFITGGAGTVVNRSTITGYSGVFLGDGGSVTNGSASDTSARIQGSTGVYNFRAYAVGIAGAAGTVTNFGHLGTDFLGVILAAGGVVTNGSNGDTSAYISDVYVDTASPSRVINFGTMNGVGSSSGYQTVINGSLTDTTALIDSGNIAIVQFGGSNENVYNYGTLISRDVNFDPAVFALDSTVVNGSDGDTTALMKGFDGVGAYFDTVANFATIRGFGGTGAGVDGVGFILTNGSARDSAALIQGDEGVTGSQGSTVTNFGTIDGTGGVAVQFGSASDVLVVEARSTFIGAVLGGGATLVLAAGGGGTISTAQASGGMNETVSGPIASTLFTNFSTVEAVTGTAFAVTGDGVIAAGQDLDAAGGTLIFGQAITGAGAITAGAGGILTVEAAAAATLAMNFTGADATLALASPTTFAATVTGFAGSDVIDLLATRATAATLGAGDILTIMDGSLVVASLQLAGTYAGDTFSVGTDHHSGTDITVDAPEVWPAVVKSTASPSTSVSAVVAGGGQNAQSVWGAGQASVTAAVRGAVTVASASHQLIAAMAGVGAGVGAAAATAMIAAAHADTLGPIVSPRTSWA